MELIVTHYHLDYILKGPHDKNHFSIKKGIIEIDRPGNKIRGTHNKHNKNTVDLTTCSYFRSRLKRKTSKFERNIFLCDFKYSTATS